MANDREGFNLFPMVSSHASVLWFTTRIEFGALRCIWAPARSSFLPQLSEITKESTSVHWVFTWIFSLFMQMYLTWNSLIWALASVCLHIFRVSFSSMYRNTDHWLTKEGFLSQIWCPLKISTDRRAQFKPTCSIFEQVPQVNPRSSNISHCAVKHLSNS